MATAKVYSEPQYVLQAPTTHILSEAKPLKLSPGTLSAINYLLDELLHLWIHGALTGSSSPQPPAHLRPQSAGAATGPLGPDEVLTTERLKAGVLRVVKTYLGKDAVLEAELAMREVLRLGTPSLRGDPALRKASFSSFAPSNAANVASQPDDVFRAIRATVQSICSLGSSCPTNGKPASMPNHLMGLMPPPVLSLKSPHLTFLTCLYAERCMVYIAEHIIRALGRVCEREAGKDTAGLEDLEAAVGEDEAIWSFVKGMRVRGFIENEIAISRARSSGGSVSSHGGHASPSMSPSSKKGLMSANMKPSQSQSSISSRMSNDSRSSGKGLLYGGTKKLAEFGQGLGISKNENSNSLMDGFEKLMSSGKTMKVSLTPNRLKTMESYERERLTSNMSAISTATTVPPPPVSPPRRLQARSARSDPDEEESTEDSEDDNPFGGRKPQKESLMELLSQPPPWSGDSTTPTQATFASPPRARRGSAQKGSKMSPIAASPGSSFASSTGSASDVLNSRRGSANKYVAKDPRSDIHLEREVNSDLADFLESEPPPGPNGRDSPVRRTAGILGAGPRVAAAAVNKEEDPFTSPSQPARIQPPRRASQQSIEKSLPSPSPSAEGPSRKLAYGELAPVPEQRKMTAPLPPGLARDDPVKQSVRSPASPTGGFVENGKPLDAHSAPSSRRPTTQAQRASLTPVVATGAAAALVAGGGAAVASALKPQVNGGRDTPASPKTAVAADPRKPTKRSSTVSFQMPGEPAPAPVNGSGSRLVEPISESMLLSADEAYQNNHHIIEPVLRVLKLQMAGARSADECKALLESFMRHSKDEARSASRLAGGPPGFESSDDEEAATVGKAAVVPIAVAAAAAATAGVAAAAGAETVQTTTNGGAASEADSEEESERLMALFFLGGSDLVIQQPSKEEAEEEATKKQQQQQEAPVVAKVVPPPLVSSASEDDEGYKSASGVESVSDVSMPGKF